MLCHWYKNDNKFQETWCWSFFGCYMLWVAWVTSCDWSPVGWVLTHTHTRCELGSNLLKIYSNMKKSPLRFKSRCSRTKLHCRVLLCVCIDMKYLLKWFDIVYEYMWYNDICVSDIGFNLIIRYIYILFTIWHCNAITYLSIHICWISPDCLTIKHLPFVDQGWLSGCQVRCLAQFRSSEVARGGSSMFIGDASARIFVVSGSLHFVHVMKHVWAFSRSMHML